MKPIRVGKTRKCIRCRNIIFKNSVCAAYKELALTNYEACHAGTQYPTRYVCKGCITSEEMLKMRQSEGK